MRRILISFLTIILAFAVGMRSSNAYSEYGDLQSTTTNVDSCQVILTRAMETLQEACGGLGRNKACYGNNLVKAEPVQNASLKFDAQGDIVSVREIKTLSTSPLNAESGTWGLSLLKLQANLPDTLPGQNVTFLVYGNTEIENVSGDMQAFYFSAGLGNPTCKEAPTDSIVVKSPNHTEITFTANGAQITIASTIVLSAVAGQSMTVGLVEGHAKVTTAQGSQELKPGQKTSVPLGGANGLTASGSPSKPADFDSTPYSSVIDTTVNVSDPDAPVNVVLEGCIDGVGIDVVKGNWITISEYEYPINVGNNQALKDAEVGDCVELEGILQTGVSKTNKGNGLEFILLKGKKSDNIKPNKNKKDKVKPGNNKGGAGMGAANGNSNGNGNGGGNAGGNGGGK